ncbi:MAG: hypothetical protein KC478_07140 [Bacteriovoracaceae bacterium]|nr:hypothetical protein [Bacteriovoracaceae bacterium]
MKNLIILFLCMSSGAYASDIEKFVGNYELVQGNCPMDLKVDSLAGHALLLRDTNSDNKVFLQFSGIGQGSQTMYAHDWSSKTCYENAIDGNTVKYESARDVSIYRPCWSVSKDTLYSIELYRGELTVQTQEKSCLYQKTQPN